MRKEQIDRRIRLSASANLSVYLVGLIFRVVDWLTSAKKCANPQSFCLSMVVIISAKKEQIRTTARES